MTSQEFIISFYTQHRGSCLRQFRRVSHTFMDVWMYGHTYGKSKDQPGKVANPARGQLNKENEYFPVPVRA